MTILLSKDRKIRPSYFQILNSLIESLKITAIKNRFKIWVITFFIFKISESVIVMSDGIESEKKNTNIFLAGMILWYFMSGMEYSLILTTINSYLLSTGAPQKSIGYVFTYFAFSGLISSPIYGWVKFYNVILVCPYWGIFFR